MVELKNNGMPVTIAYDVARGDNEIAKAIIENSNTPIAAPSANVSGKPSGTNIEDIRKELESNVDFVIDGGIYFDFKHWKPKTQCKRQF